MKFLKLPLSVFLSLSWARAQNNSNWGSIEGRIVEGHNQRGHNQILSDNKTPLVPQQTPNQAFRILEEYVWHQIGSDIDGEAPNDQSGYSVALSDDKSTLAIGAWYNDGNGAADVGHVRVFRCNEETEWVQIGTDLDGKSAGDLFGTSVAVSSDGTTVAVGGLDKSDGAGHVRIFRLLNDWIQIGPDIVGETSGDNAGRSVSLSDDGNIVAIGSPMNDSDAGLDVGQVRVYAYSLDRQTFEQLGEDIQGEQELDSFGFAVSLSGDGRTIAIGTSRSGSVRVFKYLPNSNWKQIGNTIPVEGAIEADMIGIAVVALSKAGDVAVIGAPFSGANGKGNASGIVSIYQLLGNELWTRIGNQIEGERADDSSGVSVDISDDGDVVAIGGFLNTGVNGEFSGHVRVYKRDQDSWTLIGGDLDGESSRDLFGRSVSISGDGSMLAIGGPSNDGTNGLDSGHVRVFSLEMKTLQPSLSPSYLPSISPSISPSYFRDINLFTNGFWNPYGQSFESNRETSMISMDSSGNYIAIGEPSYACINNADLGCGKVEIYSFSEYSWVQVGNAIIGNSANANFGKVLELSSNGRAIVIGGLAGTTSVYEFDGDTWQQLGMIIRGEAGDDLSGISVSIAGDGATSGVTHPYRYIIGIGAPYNDGSNENAGHARIFGFSSKESWVQITADINGVNASDMFGMTLSLSRNGSTIAVSSAPFPGPFNVKVYRGSGIEQWEQVGQDIVSNELADLFGRALNLSANGKILAVGAQYAGADNSGSVRVFQLESGYWTQLGQTISGESGVQSGSSVSLSDDGLVVAIGSARPQAIRSYWFSDGKWIQISDRIDGFQKASLAADGTRLVGNGQDGVQSFELLLPTPTPSASPTETAHPSSAPSYSQVPSKLPTSTPSVSSQPSLAPSNRPTLSVSPSVIPSTKPSFSNGPSFRPAQSPTTSPSKEPSTFPSILTSVQPTSSNGPSLKPSHDPSPGPSRALSEKPSRRSLMPSSKPSAVPSLVPSSSPSGQPSMVPSDRVSF